MYYHASIVLSSPGTRSRTRRRRGSTSPPICWNIALVLRDRQGGRRPAPGSGDVRAGPPNTQVRARLRRRRVLPGHRSECGGSGGGSHRRGDTTRGSGMRRLTSCIRWTRLINQETRLTCGDGSEVLALDNLPALGSARRRRRMRRLLSSTSRGATGGWVSRRGRSWLSHLRVSGGRWEGEEAAGRSSIVGGRARRRAEVGGAAGPSGTYKNTPTLGADGLVLGDPDTAV